MTVVSTLAVARLTASKKVRAWNVDITVDLGGGKAAICHATVFSDTARGARSDGRQLLEAVCRNSNARVAGVSVSPAQVHRPPTLAKLGR
jgi:hypothetical protein